MSKILAHLAKKSTPHHVIWSSGKEGGISDESIERYLGETWLQAPRDERLRSFINQISGKYFNDGHPPLIYQIVLKLIDIELRGLHYGKRASIVDDSIFILRKNHVRDNITRFISTVFNWRLTYLVT